jgi:lipopolysaccharide export system protein LptC
MSSNSRPATHPPDGAPVGRLVAGATAKLRRQLDARALARRRQFILIAKWCLPIAALMLLTTIAIWPEMERIENGVRTAAKIAGDVTAARLTDAYYHSVDDHNRPYTLSATIAQQVGPDRVNLTSPKGDITLENGSWVMLRAKQGVYMQHSNLLDLSHDVTLYRDDGTTLVTASASMDLNRGAAAGSEPVHAEGPFGTLEAQGFTLTDKGALIDFTGPAKLVLNGASPAKTP